MGLARNGFKLSYGRALGPNLIATNRIAGSLSTFTLLILMVLPVQAAPALSKGSFAHYALTADLQASQTCNASSITYNQTACGPYIPTYYVTIYENIPGMCTSSGNFSSACGFSPSYINVGAGYRFVWTNSGQLPHTVTSCSTANAPPAGACPTMNALSLPSFGSGVLSSGGSFEYTFDQQGSYNYYCAINPWMHGTVVVSGPGPYPQPQPPAPMFDLSGGVGWQVLNIDNTVALLKVSHEISFTQGPASFSEAGSFEESIDLATRIHESGTLVQLLETLLRGYAAALPPYYYPSPILLGLRSSESEPMYTFWWVNGPLADSSPVLILMGYSGVRGSETLDLGGNIGQRIAWIVASEVSQSFTTKTPYPNATTTASVDISLRFDFDQKSDLLLKSVFLVQVFATVVTTYEPGQTLCGIGGCRTVSGSERVIVTQEMTASASLMLQLDDTNIPPDQRTHAQSTGTQSGSTTPPGGTSNPPDSPGLQTSALLPIGIVSAAALGLVSLGVWVVVRSRRKPLQALDGSTPAL